MKSTNRLVNIEAQLNDEMHYDCNEDAINEMDDFIFDLIRFKNYIVRANDDIAKTKYNVFKKTMKYFERKKMDCDLEDDDLFHDIDEKNQDDDFFHELDDEMMHNNTNYVSEEINKNILNNLVNNDVPSDVENNSDEDSGLSGCSDNTLRTESTYDFRGESESMCNEESEIKFLQFNAELDIYMKNKVFNNVNLHIKKNVVPIQFEIEPEVEIDAESKLETDT